MEDDAEDADWYADDSGAEGFATSAFAAADCDTGAPELPAEDEEVDTAAAVVLSSGADERSGSARRIKLPPPPMPTLPLMAPSVPLPDKADPFEAKEKDEGPP